MKSSAKTLVLKIGGTEGVNFPSICKDIARTVNEHERLVIVHGGSQKANDLGEALGHPPRFVTSPSGFTSRYTDRKTLEIFIMAVNGYLNTTLTAELQSSGVNALGISGVDGKLLVGRRKPAIRINENGRQKVLRDDHTGTITSVNTALVDSLLEEGYIPVIAPLAISEQSEPLNVDADRVAAMIAASLQADTLMLLTAVPGILNAFPDESSLISKLDQSEIKSALNLVQGRMKKKVLGAKEALAGNVRRVIIADGRIEHPVSKALNGGGTEISS
ncbi:MAG: [LysW]-aminoadipate kinase [Chloroflexi bacterium]|nr:[LysW]-aminoadipate kinase [Chloroflexota bacterium]